MRFIISSSGAAVFKTSIRPRVKLSWKITPYPWKRTRSTLAGGSYEDWFDGETTVSNRPHMQPTNAPHIQSASSTTDDTAPAYLREAP